MAFQQLKVYALAEQLCDAVYQMVRCWDYLARDTVGKQLIRAADSVGANIAEGSGRGTASDHCRFVFMARGSLFETAHFLRRAYQRGLLSKEQQSVLQPVMDVLGPKLNRYLSANRARTSRSTPGTTQATANR